MASTLLDKLDESLKCGICLENFRSPRGLPCLHSFCEECLERWSKKSEKPGVVTCPNCSKDAQIPEGGVAEFPAHFLVNSLQESVDIEKTKEEGVVCGYCDTPGTPSTFCCMNCNEFMCVTCHNDVHKKIKAFKSHQVVTIEDPRFGKSASPPKVTYCDKHDGEQIKFYCETCDRLVCRDCILMKKCCRDHEYCTLKEAAQSKADCLRGIIKECQESKKKCQSAIGDAEREEIDLIEKFSNDRGALSSKKNGLQDMLAKINRACDFGIKLMESRSDMEILSNYSTILETLQEASNTKPVPADIPVATYPDTSARMYIKTLKPWDEVGEYSTQGGQPIGITTTPGDDIAILFSDKVKVFSWSGDIKHSFSSPPNESGDSDITCMMDGKYVIAGRVDNKCHIYDAQGEELSSFQVLDADGNPAGPVSVAVDNQGNIIVASVVDTGSTYMLSTHSSAGAPISSFITERELRSLAVTENGNIAVCTVIPIFEDENGFLLMDFSALIHKTFSPKEPPDIETWSPSALCCSKKDGLIFVIQYYGEEDVDKGVYMYTSDGEYLMCVTTEVKNCCGIALSQDGQRMVVPNEHRSSFKIFQRP